MTNQEKIPEIAAGLRRRAEEIARGKAAIEPFDNLANLSPEEARQLLHDLHVHQIELEMQNEELRRVQADLDASRTRYFDLYDLAPVGYCTLSEMGLILEANLTLATLLGVARGMLAGKPLSRFIHPEDKDQYYLYIRGLFKKGEPQSCDLRMQRADAVSFWAYLQAASVQDKESRISIHDITRRKLAEEALRQAHDKLEQRGEEQTLELRQTHAQLLHAEKLSAIGALSASIAHEFNNPLQGVMNIVKGVRKRAPLSEDDAELMDIAYKECIRMRDLIKSLQGFNRPISGRMAPVDIHALIDDILLLGEKNYNNKQILIKKSYAERMPRIQAVADQIKQVILNLLNNAVDACESGSTITFGTEAAPENVIITVQDTGKGIRPEDLEHIFEPFFSTKPAIKGTGLGLLVSYGIVKAHGGEIKVKSEVGKGSVFFIILPIFSRDPNGDAK